VSKARHTEGFCPEVLSLAPAASVAKPILASTPAFAYDDCVSMRTDPTPPPESTVGAFGEKLRKQREQRGLDLEAISKTTKISTRMLRALEDEHFDQLPGGIFNKGFVRAYARQVGLDEEETVADYLAASREKLQPRSVPPDFRDPAAKPTPVAAPGPGDNVLTDLPADTNNDDGNDQDQQRRADAQRQREDRRKHGRRDEDRRNDDRRNDERRNDDQPHEDRRPRTKEQKYPAGDPDHPAAHSSAPIPWGKLALALLLVTLLLAVWNFRRHAQLTATSQPVPVSNQSPAAVSAPASTAAAGNQPTGKLPPATIAASTPPDTRPAPSAAAPTTPATSSASKPAPEPDTDSRAAKPTAPAAAPKPPSTFTLLIRAEESTWISLIADGKPVAQENLIAPAHTSVRATREIVVKAGNAAGISFLLNGKEIPVEGNEGEVKTFVFDANGLQPQ
jgi:cytoskeletal protein RodZ